MSVADDDLKNIQRSLSDAEQALSNVGSRGGSSSHGAVSEPRDAVQEATRFQDELERLNSKSGCESGSGHGSGSSAGNGSASNLQQRLATMHGAKAELEAQVPTDRETVYASLSADQQMAVDRMIADINRKHNAELEKLQTRLDTSEDSSHTMMSNIVNMQTGSWSKAGMQECMDGARNAKASAEDERDDVKDVIAGMEARHEQALHRLMEDKKKMWDDATELNDEKRLQHAATMRVIQEELRVANKAESSNEKRDTGVRDEIEVLTRTMGTATDANAIEVMRLQELLAAANAEILRRDEVAAALPDGGGASLLDFTDQHAIEQLLRTSRDNNQELISELASGRLQLFHMKQGHAEDLAKVQKRLDDAKAEAPAASAKVKSSSASSSRSKKQGLSSINEDEEGSTPRSTTPSAGSSRETQGDSSDSPPPAAPTPESLALTAELQSRVVDLLSELAQANQAKRQLMDDTTDIDAQHMSKLARLMKNLTNANFQGKEMNEEMALLTEAGILKKDEIAVEMKAAQLDLDNARANRAVDAAGQNDARDIQTADHTASLEEVNDKLLYALEMKRIDSVRLEDTKLELSKMEERHQRTVADLTSRLHLYEASQEHGTAPMPESEVVKRMQITEGERNQLRNDLEQKEVIWKQELEHAQQNHRADLEQLSNVQTKLEEERCLHKQLQLQLNEREEKLKVAASAPPPIEQSTHMQPAPPSWFEQLFAWVGSINSSEQTLAQAGQSEISCQQAVWQILTFMPDLVALQCSAGDLEILDASKTAYVTWGSQALNGTSLVDLLPDKTIASWLKKRLEPQPGLGDPSDFQLKQLPCVPLASKGSTRDYSLTCACLPAEPQHCNGNVVIIIAHTMEAPLRYEGSKRAQPQGSEASSGNDGRSESRRSRTRGTPSGISVGSDDITANDSISNILPVY